MAVSPLVSGGAREHKSRDRAVAAFIRGRLMRYQPHIDGLRSVAVLPVLIYHLGSPWIPGGFVGVDVFFVISGFLITGILLDEMEAGRYSLLTFYKRRILRIMPALAVVLVATFVLSHLLLFEAERREVGKSIVASALFVSNFFFWGNAGGYFTSPEDAKPLLNTWSLAVEEQFYIFFPLLLFALVRWFRGYIIPAIAVLSLLSLALCIVLTASHPVLSFYLIPTRAWELGAGAILAAAVRRDVLMRWDHPLIAPVGLALVVAPMLYLTKDSAFPGANAIVPVLGATLLVGWGASGPVGLFLSSRAMVAIGRISYSLYLWHWPVIVFWKSYSGAFLDPVEMLALGGVSLALGALSTIYVERPFRSARALSIAPGRVIVLTLPVLALLAGLGWATTRNTFQFRTIPDEVQRTAEVADYINGPDYERQFRFGSCMIGSSEGEFDVYDKAACATPKADAINVLLIGDSHAAQFWGALDEAFGDVNVMQATASGCRPLIGAPGAERCTDMRDWVYQDFLPNNRVDAVILGGRWRTDEMPFVHESLEALKRHADHVIVFGPTVEYEGVFPKMLAVSMLNGHPFDAAEARTPGRDEVNGLMKQAVAEAGLPYIDVLGTVCPPEGCVLRAPDGVPMQFDYGHLTLSGARYVVDAHLDALRVQPN